MFKMHSQIRKKKESSPAFKNILRNEDGAIDLASIMVGIIVIGLIGGVIASTVFVVIPWTQDNAAKQQLDSVVSAESAYFGLSADNPPALPAGSKPNTFGKSADLAAAKLMGTGPRYCVTTPDDGKSYTAYSQSSTGVVFTVTDKNTKATALTVPAGSTVTASLPADCQFITDGITSSSGSSPTTPPVAAYIDPTPTITKMTYKCDAGTSGSLPFNTISQGTLTISGDDGSNFAKAYTGVTWADSQSFKAGVTYTVTLDGKYSWLYQSSALSACLRSLDHWGEQTGVTKAQYGLYNSPKLTSVPDHIPSTVTDLTSFFDSATIFNDPDVTKWDVSNVTTFAKMFNQAQAFNQPLNDWNMSKATNIVSMLAFTYAFNQPLDKWDTSNVTDMAGVFTYAKVFNQNINSWNVSKATRMTMLFSGALKFDQPLDKWNVSNVTKMDEAFRDTPFNQDIGMWRPAKVTNMDLMFAGNSKFNQNLSSWTFNVRPSYTNWQPTTPGYPTTYYPKFIP